MRTATESFDLSCPPEGFWRVDLDPEYVRALYLGALGYKACEVPRPIEALLGDGFAYEDPGDGWARSW